ADRLAQRIFSRHMLADKRLIDDESQRRVDLVIGIGKVPATRDRNLESAEVSGQDGAHHGNRLFRRPGWRMPADHNPCARGHAVEWKIADRAGRLYAWKMRELFRGFLKEAN